MTLKLLNTADAGHDVILVAGQSNAVSYGDGTVDFTYLDAVDPRIVQWPGSGIYFGLGRPVAAIDPLFHHEQWPASVGLAMTFAREYLRTIPTNRKVLLVPTAHGSTGFSSSSVSPAPTGYHTRSGGGWDPSGGQGGINLYEFAIAQANAALAENPNNRIVAVIWVQGEEDATVGMSQAAYATYLDTLIAGFRSRITGATSVPFLIGQMLPDGLAGNAGELVINAAHIDTPRRTQRSAFFYGVTGYAKGDYNPPIHYTNEGQRRQGYRAYGVLAAARANKTGTAPLALTAPTLMQVGTTVSVQWVRPISRATDYNLRYSVDGGTTWTALTRAQSIDYTAAVTGQTLGQTIQVQVRAVNETGTSAWSPSGSITLLTLPGQPTAVTAGSPTSGAVPVSWTAPGSGGALATYLVEFKKRSDSTWAAFGSVSAASTIVTGLANTTLYDFRVTAQNAAGSGTVSSTASATTLAPTPLIDDVGVAAYRALGTRKLSSTATKAIRVRRSSDNTQQDIGFVNNDLDTAALLTFCGVGSGYVVTWYDQSGNARDMTNATTAQQARIVNAGVLDVQNSKPCAVFAGTSYYTDTTNFGLYAAGAATSIGVLQGTGTGASFMHPFCEQLGGSNDRYGLVGYLFSDNKIHPVATNHANTAMYNVSQTMTAGLLSVAATVDTGTSAQVWVDGATTSPTTYTRSGSVLTPDRSILGGQAASGTGAWNGGISELVFFASALTTTQRQIGQTNARNYYSTT